MKILLCSAATMAITSAAWGQNIPDRNTATEGSTSPSQDGIAEIVVTASRRAENIQRSALSIQALSREALARANITKPEDLGAIAPGLSVAAGGGYPQAYIRGIGTFGGNSVDEGAIAFNLDGIYISRSWATRGMFYDLDRVEVLKGPQGTLYGRNASGGAINVITAKPKIGETSGFIEAAVGNYSLLQGSGALNLPLGDAAAVRISGHVVDRDGYLSDGSNDDKTRSARVQLLWKPTDIFSLALAGNYQHTGGRGAGPALHPQAAGDKFRSATDPAVRAIYQAEPFIGGFLNYPKPDNFIRSNVYAFNAELNWHLDFATLTVLPAYRDAELHDRHYMPGFSVEDNEHDRQTSLEVRLGNSSDKLKWVVGAFYFNEHQTSTDGDLHQRVLQGVNTQIVDNISLKTRSYAAFGQATYSITDIFRVTGGLRYTYERKLMNGLEINYSFPNQAPPPACASGRFDPTSPYVPLFCRLDIPLVGQRSFKSVTYKAGVEFDIAPRSMAYANYSTGFKSGGYFFAPPPNTFKPEKLESLELGVKNRFLDNRLQINLEGFFWRYKDHQESYIGPTNIPGFFTFLTINAGRAKSYGGNIDLQFRPTSRDELSLNLQYNKSRYDSFAFNSPAAIFGTPVTGCAVGPLQGGFQRVDCSGLPLMRAPLWAGTAGYNHSFKFEGHGTLVAGIHAQFASGSYLAPDFLKSEYQKSYAIGDVDLTYTSESGRWVISAFVHNIWNEPVYDFLFRSPFVSKANPLANPDGAITGAIRPPRTFGGKIRVNF